MFNDILRLVEKQIEKELGEYLRGTVTKEWTGGWCPFSFLDKTDDPISLLVYYSALKKYRYVIALWVDTKWLFYEDGKVNVVEVGPDYCLPVALPTTIDMRYHFDANVATLQVAAAMFKKETTNK